MSDTGRMLLTTFMTVELFRLILSNLNFKQCHRLTLVCKEFYAHREQVQPIHIWIRQMYREWLKIMLGYITVREDGEEILYWDDNHDNRRDWILKSTLGPFCRFLFREISGQLLCKIRIELKMSRFFPVVNKDTDQITEFEEKIEKITLFSCDPATPTEFDFKQLLECGLSIVTKLEQPVPNTPEGRALSYKTHKSSFRLIRPEIMEEPIEIPEDRLVRINKVIRA